MGKFIIFGGDGFLGTYTADMLLKRGNDVLICDLKRSNYAIYDNPNCMFQKADITNTAELTQVPFSENSTVIHLAANQYHLQVPRDGREEFFFAVNYAGTENILQSMDAAECHRLVYFSTDMTYGKPQFLPVTEEHPQNPFGPYGSSKKASEDLCRRYREKEFSITIFRPRMILGPGRLGILKKLFKLIDWGLPVPLIGSGQNCYQMVSVFDCAEAIGKAIEKGLPNGEYNLGSDSPPLVHDLLHDLIKSAHSKSVLVRTNGKFVKGCLKILGSVGAELLYREQYEIADENYIVDISRAKNELGWCPRYTDTDMLYQAYKYYEQEKVGKIR